MNSMNYNHTTKNNIEITGAIGDKQSSNFVALIGNVEYNMSSTGDIVDYYTTSDRKATFRSLSEKEAKRLSTVTAKLSTELDELLEKDHPIRKFLQ